MGWKFSNRLCYRIDKGFGGFVKNGDTVKMVYEKAIYASN